MICNWHLFVHQGTNFSDDVEVVKVNYTGSNYNHYYMTFRAGHGKADQTDKVTFRACVSVYQIGEDRPKEVMKVFEAPNA